VSSSIRFIRNTC